MAYVADACCAENYTTEEFIEEISEKVDSNVLSLFHVNIRSIKNKFEDLAEYLEELQHKFAVIGITETWQSEYDMEGYRAVHLRRNPGKVGGGISIYVRDDLPFRCFRKTDFTKVNSDIECRFIEFNRKHLRIDVNVVVGVIYRPPGSITNFSDQLSEILDTLQKPSNVLRFIYLMGDFNVTQGGVVMRMLDSRNMERLILCPTRSERKPDKVLDGIFSSEPRDLAGILDCHKKKIKSDHRPIFAIDQTNGFNAKR
ncbi:hypothetical protein CAPTEDRAFT_210904 [Capitella teleta]|uniref:Endonuclease/exonuclease/phosphatase domain-containing protein n=1 Tax=Capitella teleta TaxID=283909 RepID=R7V799_CAPTE|nr:hypothetical protein CAPTEDRAFT_210904 [Capitella teleta]|eukprot:ELU14449.1 hypothetical protein CAPTEDRAFT_210904 [Capitella teleta]